MRITKKCRMGLVLIAILFVLTGCRSNHETTSQSLADIGVPLSEVYSEAVVSEYPIYGVLGLRQRDSGPNDSIMEKGPVGEGSFTQINLQVEDHGEQDSGWLNLTVLELRAYPKEDVKKNCTVTFGENGTAYRMKDLEPYRLFETEEYVVYDLMCFGYDEQERLEGFITAYRQVMEKSETYNPDRDAEAIADVIPQVRQWLIEQIKADYP